MVEENNVTKIKSMHMDVKVRKRTQTITKIKIITISQDRKDGKGFGLCRVFKDAIIPSKVPPSQSMSIDKCN